MKLRKSSRSHKWYPLFKN